MTPVRGLLVSFSALLLAGAAAAQPLEPIDPAELSSRRARVFEAIGDAVAFVYGAEEPGSYVAFRQNNDLYYLAGLVAPASYLILDGKAKTALLLVPGRNPMRERWEGPRPGPDDETKAATGVDEVRNAKDLTKILDERLARAKVVFMPLGPEENGPAISDSLGPLYAFRRTHPLENRPSRETHLKEAIAARAPKAEIKDLTPVIRKLRAIKSPSEIARIRRASETSARAHVELMKAARPGLWEYELAALFEYHTKREGSARLGYHSIVGSGPNSCVLHYSALSRRLENGDMICVDAGAEMDYYVTDVTRSYPANGRFTPEQRRIYETVLAAQKAAIAACRPGTTLQALEKIARKIIRDAGFGDEYFPHGLGHHVGFAVHDAGGKDLEPGSVITIEPGIYDRKTGIGVRIEDTLVVTPDGCENLSAGAPREIAEIEALMARTEGQGGR